jgi:hypothetical protein
MKVKLNGYPKNMTSARTKMRKIGRTGGREDGMAGFCKKTNEAMSRFGFDQGGTGRFKAGKKFTNDTPLLQRGKFFREI